MTKALVIKASGEIISFPDDWEWGLPALQTAVGGLIESLPTPWENVSLYSNEEGKFIGENGGPLPTNHLVTALVSQWLHPGDFIAGDVVAIGYDPETGESVSLPEDVAVAIRAFAKLQQEVKL